MKPSTTLLSIFAASAAAQPFANTASNSIHKLTRRQQVKEIPDNADDFWNSYNNARVKDLSCNENTPEPDWHICASLCNGPENEPNPAWGPDNGIMGYWTNKQTLNAESNSSSSFSEPSGAKPFRPWSLKCWHKEDWLKKEAATVAIFGGRVNQAGITIADGVKRQEMIARGVGGVTPFRDSRDDKGERVNGTLPPYSPFNNGSLVAFGIHGLLFLEDDSLPREDQTYLYNQLG